MNTQKKSSDKSLKFKLIFLSMSITLVLGGASFGVLKYIVNTQESEQLHSFEGYARSLSDAISAQFFERYGDVQTFSISPAIQSSNRQSIIEMLNTFSAMYGIYDLIMLVDAKGKLVAVNNKSPDGKEILVRGLYEKNYSDTPWFKAVMSGQFTEDKEKGFSGTYVEDVQIDPWTTEVLGANRLGNSFSAAVKDAKGNTIGVISNRAGSRWFEVAFKELYSSLKKSGLSHTTLTMLRSDGVVSYEYAPNRNSEKIEDSTYNWDVLLKFNLAASGLESAKDVITGKFGSAVQKNTRTKELQVAGFVPVQSQKFINKIGWSVLVRESFDEAMEALNRAQHVFYGLFALIIALASLASYLFSVSLSKRLSSLASRLSEGSNEVSSAAATISQSSTELSESATEQASAIQETAASIDEVSSMVKKSADNATQSQKVSQTSRKTAEEGQEAVQEMIQSINDISQSNASIMSQVEDGNRQIGAIVKVISEIENKTKVINDIVFQTKLLSFNASVEAARAGEHGKGFAVVAEEVGNLAQMSGNAAKEISSMLESSIQKVEGIVNDTKTKVERLIVESKTKVETGTQVAQKCGEVLSKILTSVQEVDGMVGEISSASQEQAQGVSEINKAMNQLDQVTQQNTAVAQSSAISAEQLSSQAEQLRQMVQDLFHVINGSTEEVHIPSGNYRVSEVRRAPSKKSSDGNVVAIGKNKPEAKDSQPKPLKMAAGAENLSTPAHLPSKDDPRFEDV